MTSLQFQVVVSSAHRKLASFVRHFWRGASRVAGMCGVHVCLGSVVVVVVAGVDGVVVGRTEHATDTAASSSVVRVSQREAGHVHVALKEVF